MNPIIEVLKNQKGTEELTYRNSFSARIAKPTLVVYFDNYRVKVTNHDFLLYVADPYDGFYGLIYESEDGLDNDEYFNLSIQCGLNDICLKDNIDTIRSILHNIGHGLHIVDTKRD